MTLSTLGDAPPKRVKSGHLLSDYRQKCVNATRHILMSKARKMTILTITMFNENVHTAAVARSAQLETRDRHKQKLEIYCCRQTAD